MQVREEYNLLFSNPTKEHLGELIAAFKDFNEKLKLFTIMHYKRTTELPRHYPASQNTAIISNAIKKLESALEKI